MAKPLKQCNKARCRKLIPYDTKYCEEHQGADHKEYNKARYLTDKKYVAFYNSKAWRKLSKYKLTVDPLCEICLAIDEDNPVPAVLVHHLIETKVDWSKRLEMSNLQSVCFACHNAIDHKG
ncbi:HNH endonuclease [Carnobacterium maltaromaticum]|uniref:HNH endonuclease n=1 Tax=Carnobacterium maltaromaticum TaxID=2751 RepID=UPI000555B710|nr:HNH endonuclease [Carnobacterium maltaromaticum]